MYEILSNYSILNLLSPIFYLDFKAYVRLKMKLGLINTAVSSCFVDRSIITKHLFKASQIRSGAQALMAGQFHHCADIGKVKQYQKIICAGSL